MNKELMRACFRAYRARINDLEEEVGSLNDALDEQYSCSERMASRFKTSVSYLEDNLRNEKYERWSLEDRVKKLERV